MTLTKLTCALLLTGGLAWPAFAAQGDAGSGPTKGASPSLNKPTGDQGSMGAGQSAAINRGATSDSTAATPSPSSTGGAQPATPGGAHKP
jgi:hypothetical protein